MANADKILTEQIEKKKTPSLQYLFFDKDNIIYQFRDGFADVKNRIKTTEDTTYHAYSITKTFTALAILQMANRHKIDIRLPVANYLPQFPYPSNITVEQVMSHSAGIPGPIPLRWIHRVEEHGTFDRNEYFKEVFNKNKQVKNKPNEKFAYSNLGYVLLGQMIERISQTRYEDYIQDNIIKPLHITKNELGFEVGINHHAKGYHKNFSLSNAMLGVLIDKSKFMDAPEGRWKPFKDNYVNGASYGGLIGTARALAKYIQELLKPENILISAEYKKRMFTENFTQGNIPSGMCLSWFTGRLKGKQFYTHAGGGGGFYCEIRIYPDEGVGSVIMFNRTGMRDERFLDKVDLNFLKLN
jgi:D-alanyl-D-alanine carboxypeptidase